MKTYKELDLLRAVIEGNFMIFGSMIVAVICLLVADFIIPFPPTCPAPDDTGTITLSIVFMMIGGFILGLARQKVEYLWM